MAKINGLNTSGLPVGTIVASQTPNTTPPPGFLFCDGSSVVKATYQALYNKLAGSVTETTTNFNLPDLRGEFLRGLDTTASTIDPDKSSRTGGNATTKLGSKQEDVFRAHTHNYNARQSTPNIAGSGGSYDLFPNVMTTSAAGGNETRPRNFATNYFISYI